MKKAIYIILILLMVTGAVYAQVNGSLSEMSGKKILHVWGNHYERGYAQGYLLSQPIMQIYQNYIFNIIAMGNPLVYNTLINFYLDSFSVEQKYQQEAQGVIDGMTSSGTDITIVGLGRDLMKEDLLTFNCIVDIYPYFSQIKAIGGSAPGCASLSSWGVSTQADSLLAGNLVISRMLDWDSDLNLISNPLLMISHPSEPDEQKWISFTYPGLIGALSGISHSGKAAFLNMGNIHSNNAISNLHPVLLSIRNSIEGYDYNFDMSDNLTDVFTAVSDGLSLSGTIIHTVSPALQTGAGIIETNNISGTVLRTTAQNGSLPGSHLIATNHFRLLSYPVCCDRYVNIADSLTANPNVTAKRQLGILRFAAGQDNNMMLIQYTPSTGRILWSTASTSQPAHLEPMITLDANELFGYVTSLDDATQSPAVNYLRVYPNPAGTGSQVTILSDGKSAAPIHIYNIKGQRIARLEGKEGQYRWNGQTESGITASAGVYLLKQGEGPAQVKTIKLLLLN